MRNAIWVSGGILQSEHATNRMDNDSDVLHAAHRANPFDVVYRGSHSGLANRRQLRSARAALGG